MDDDASSDLGDAADIEEQKSLQIYLDSLPYQCESVEEMQKKLEHIVGKLYICAKAQNWHTLTSWDGMLQCWMLMRYPMAKSTRARLVRFYFELSILPGIEPRIIRSWTDMVSRLLSNKAGQKRKLDATDLQLPWKTLWRVLRTELWPKGGILQDSSRNVVNILLFLSEQCQPYFPADEIPQMLETFIPLVTKESILTMIPVFTSFLPPARPHLYLPFLFKLWEGFNSSIIDDRLLEFAGYLSVEHVSGLAGDFGTDGAQWKDVGIWSESEWTFLVSKGLGSMNVPVGATRGASTTSSHADAMGERKSLRIKKTISRFSALAKIFVYSMATDGPVRQSSTSGEIGTGYLAGSKSLDSLDRLITSTESFFHPSNSGHWTQALTVFLQHLASQYCKRANEEEQLDCKTPTAQRLSPSIRRHFVRILRTPALLAMFSKDPTSMGYAIKALRLLSMLEPTILMPELLERAYGGLEIVNETHQTTAVMSMLSAISRPLVTESTWLGGQKHILPLLELCIPGIDLNDPAKTICASQFISNLVQHIKIGDLSAQQSGVPFTDDAPDDSEMDVDDSEFPQGTENGMPPLSRSEERSLVRDSTNAFADWVTSLFRRVLALFANLPEEGGRRNTAGKQEEAVLKSIKSMLDIVCLHLSDQLFELVLKLVFDYATQNATSNAVKAFGQLVGCLARVQPEKTVDKFLPFCVAQIEDELRNGASSVRTTSAVHAALSSDTNLHWSRCLFHLLGHSKEILDILALLIDKTKHERGYSSTGRLITHVLHKAAGIYPINSRFVNTNEWNDPEFARDHNLTWGKLYEPKDVTIEWHTPGDEEIGFILQTMDQILTPALDRVESLLETSQKWDSVDRNDFCRYLSAARSFWSGLPMLIKEGIRQEANPLVHSDIECADLSVTPLDVKAGFALTNPNDPRYQKVQSSRIRFGRALQRAGSLFKLRQNGKEKDEHTDAIDAVLGVAKGIDVYLLEYGMNKGSFDSLQKNHVQSRDSNRVWPGQKENSRLVFIKRAQTYHSGRLYMHSLYRRRTLLDDELIGELVEFSLSSYTRVRRHAQSILRTLCGYYTRSTRSIIPTLLDALAKGSDPDRMKGALYILSDKDHGSHTRYLQAALDCQHEEKPSIQKLVTALSQEALSHLHEAAVHTDSYTLSTLGADDALRELELEFPEAYSPSLLKEALAKAPVRFSNRAAIYDRTVSSILEFASQPQTHWRYVQMASRFLSSLLRRDAPVSPGTTKLFLELTTSPQPTIRAISQRAISKILAFAKVRTYSKSAEDLWRDEWRNPLKVEVQVTDPAAFISGFEDPMDLTKDSVFVDQISTGFLSWTPSVDGYRVVVGDQPAISWEAASQPSFDEIRKVITEEYLQKLAALWSQEGNSVDLRSDNVTFIKSLAKMFEHELLEPLLPVIDPLLSETDKFKQRAGGEFLAGLLRGAKHWPKKSSDKLWEWTASRLDDLFARIKPETYVLEQRDPRRYKTIIDWILSIPLDFQGESAFAMTKALLFVEVLVESFGARQPRLVENYAELCIASLGINYAELRTHVVGLLSSSMGHEWRPYYPSTNAFLQACLTDIDPLHIRDSKYGNRIEKLLSQFAEWKSQRLAPPRVNHSEYDKTAQTLLFWLWYTAHGAKAPLMIPYAVQMMPEIFSMSELNDNPELQVYSSAVLYSLSAFTVPANFIEPILENFVSAIKRTTSWRLRLNALPCLVVFFYRNLLLVSQKEVSRVMEVLLDCLLDENVEVRQMASKMLSGVVRCSQRQQIKPLKDRFVSLARKTTLPSRQDASYAEAAKVLHSAILGLCALMDSFPYSVEPWMPPLTEVLALHATDPPPISVTIRKCASDFKKDTWHKDQHAFNEDQLQSLSSMLVGTSYYSLLSQSRPANLTAETNPVGDDDGTVTPKQLDQILPYPRPYSVPQYQPGAGPPPLEKKDRPQIDRTSSSSLPIPSHIPYHALPQTRQRALEDSDAAQPHGSGQSGPSGSSSVSRASSLRDPPKDYPLKQAVAEPAAATAMNKSSTSSLAYSPAPPTVLPSPPLPASESPMSLARSAHRHAPYNAFLSHAPAPPDSWIRVESTTETYRLNCRLPGFSRDGITLATKKRRILHIVADRYEGGGGHFERRIALGYDADFGRIRAEFDGEMLRISIPRRTPQGIAAFSI
ncbi:hypothetical protein C8J56DRAFT_918063 [Mycena floridula]|nr:hypothetical protein C8J56DRAFT_918063 [Mycena floridula]